MVVLRRLASALPSIAGVIVVTFLLTRALPGDPAVYFAGPAASEQAVEEIRHKLGFDRSLPVQFIGYLKDLAHGNLGNSLSTGQPVSQELLTRLPASAELTFLALFLSVSIAVPPSSLSPMESEPAGVCSLRRGIPSKMLGPARFHGSAMRSWWPFSMA